ncbi:MAG: N-acetyl-gamma-glutamyl-phosphate reductase [Pseudomonadota bacterium]
MAHNIAILGASGYTGAELVRLIGGHPTFEIKALSGDRKAGQPMRAVYPHLRHMDLPDLARIEDIDFADIDMVFCALPHATSQSVISRLPDGVKVVDLSADFRLEDEAAYEAWYGKPHSAPELQKRAVYGLTEFYREEIRAATLVAGTGCNAATGQFALRPLVAAGVIDLDDIVLDLKAAASGAGRSPKEHLLISELYENVKPYGMGGTHRHLGEFDQELSKIAGRDVRIQFSPHLLPASRGIVVTAYLKGDAEAVHQTLASAYADEVFVHVLPFGDVPQMKDVRASNFCHLGVIGDRIPGRATVVAVLDNLTKGSSGQAIQNANLMLNVDETAGLMAAPVYP